MGEKKVRIDMITYDNWKIVLQWVDLTVLNMK